MTQKLIYKTEVVDPFGNRKLFRAYVNTETGLLRLSLEGKSGTNFAVSNMQCKGWPPDVYEEISDNPTHHLNEFIDSGLYRRDHSTAKTFQI